MDARFPGFERLGDATPFVSRIVEIIESIRVFDGFNREEIETLAPYLRCYRVPENTEAIVEGAPGNFMMLLIDGDMEITKKDKAGLPVHIGQAGPGKTLGEMSVIDGEPRFASCISICECVVAILDREALMKLATEHPSLGMKLLMQIAVLLNQRLRQVSVQYMKLLEAHAA